jgi:D-lactate dehydrogenase
MPFSSKAFSAAAQTAGGRTLEALRRASENGALPIVTDASPCAGTLKELLAEEARGGPPLRLFDFPSFWAREALPRLPQPRRLRGLAVLHPTCSLVKQGGVADLVAVARAHAEEAVVPRTAECCGFAGDKGFLVPELTQSATAVEAAEIRERLERHARESSGAPGGATTGPMTSGAHLDPPAGGGAVYSTCRTCEIGMSRAVGQPVRGIAHLVLEALERA